NYYKFITLEGDIITKGFVRAGGEVNEESVRLGRQKKIDLLEDEVKEFQKIIDKNNEEFDLIKDKSENISTELHKNNFERIKKKCDLIDKEIAKLDFKKDQFNRSIQENETAYENIDNVNHSLNADINKLIELVSKSENEQYNLDKEFIFLTDEFNIIEQNFSHDSADYNSFNIEFLKLKNELKIEEQNFSRVNNTLSMIERQISSNDETIFKDGKSIDDFSLTLKNNNEKLSELNFKIKEIEESSGDKRKIYDEKKTQQHKYDVEQRQRRIDFDNVSQKLINAQVRMKENEIRSQQVRDYILKKYEKDLSLKDPDAPVYVVEGEFDHGNSKKIIEELSERLKKLGGGYQQILFEDFENEKTELKTLTEQRDDLLESEKDIRKTIERINKEARERFLKTFDQIRQNFITIFKELFSEGDEANLRIVYEEDEDGIIAEDPLEAKIEIIAKPRGKRPTSIELLSGGEKTLTAIALLFAIYLVKPSPFCVLDEVDAPLDVANLGRFNKMIRKFSGNTQFILITHNERTMESVDRLYGVTMQEAGVTTIVETKFKTDEKLQA
ncbi:MAG: hypothetical protein ABIY50_03700, partial [Ignavibacteria bacterium]